ncbi:M20 family metallopeptidase [Tengunoibacter tsumagoiensis]|uniref:Glutamate carboxypeptidase n=1 Tax=Tengunoibacter tsumagoiensis TaxID=2014871 RepID=A0A401ZTM2_9CHLR|nr:M20 family metallopeptidase [Tengunoibacter tsumagoiensis]GCE10146.1 glutamate carboxypeptidase [Tengunoibacter tsumagoiensis]
MPQPYSQTYLPLFQSYQDELLQRLALLVNIDSGTGQVEGINQVMAHLQQWLTELDFIVTLHPNDEFGANLVARRQGKGTRKILLVGHVDTVYAAGAVQAQPFAIQDGVAHGPGVIDMKSGVVMGLYALRALLESGFDQFGELVVVWNNDEEVGSPGSSALLQQIAHEVDYGLVLEPSGKPTGLTQARKGADKYVLEISGVSAHSGVEPYKGRSAVIELAHKILAIQNLHALFPGVTFNITRLSSSETLNIVPDQASCHISVRAFSLQALEAAGEALNEVASSSTLPGTKIKLTCTHGRRPYEPTPAVSHMLELAKIEGEGVGLKLHAEPKGGVSDANNLMAAGLPTLDTLGPVGGGMHNLDIEHLRVASLPVRGALVAGLIHRLCLSEPLHKA